MDFIVLSRHEFESGFLTASPYIVISISDPKSRKPRIPRTSLCRAVLQLRFHDAEPTLGFRLPANVKLMRPAEAQQIRKFVNEHVAGVQTIVVHCEQGMSRSPAVAAAVCRLLGEDDSPFFRNYAPNRYVYELVLNDTAPHGDQEILS